MSHEQRTQRLLGTQRYEHQSTRPEIEADLSFWRGLSNAAVPVRRRRLLYGTFSIIGGIAAGWLFAMESSGDPVAFFAPVALGIALSVYFFRKARQANVGEEAHRLDLADQLLRSVALDDTSPAKCVVDLSDDEAANKVTQERNLNFLGSHSEANLEDVWFVLEGALSGGPSIKLSRADLVHRTYQKTANGSRTTWQYWHADVLEIRYDPNQYPGLSVQGIALPSKMTGGIKEHSPGRLLIEATSPKSGQRTNTLDTLRQLTTTALGLFGVAGKWLSTTPLREPNQEAYAAGLRAFGASPGAHGAPKAGRKFLYASLASFVIALSLGLFGYEDLERAQYRREWAMEERFQAKRLKQSVESQNSPFIKDYLRRAADSEAEAKEIHSNAIFSLAAALILSGLGAFLFYKSRQEK
jgi:hypothetical protein